MFGLWYGVLLARGFEIETVRPSTWKRQLKLNCKEKDGSRELAKQLFPDSSDYLKSVHAFQSIMILRYQEEEGSWSS